MKAIKKKVLIGIVVAAVVGGSLCALKPWEGPRTKGEIAAVLKFTRPDGTVEVTRPALTSQAVLWKDKPFRKIELAWEITVTVDGQSGIVEFQRSSYLRWRQHKPAGRVTGRRSFVGDKSSLGSTYRTPWSPLKREFFEEKPAGTYVMFGDIVVNLKATVDGKVYDPSTKSELVRIKVKVARAYKLMVSIEPCGPKRIT